MKNYETDEEVGPNTGTLGQDVQAHEDARVAAITDRSPVETHPSQALTEITAQAAAQKAVTTVLRASFADVRLVLRDLQHDILTQTETMKQLDVPLEQVADSHERATSSFERLRADIKRVEDKVDKLVAALEKNGR